MYTPKIGNEFDQDGFEEGTFFTAYWAFHISSRQMRNYSGATHTCAHMAAGKVHYGWSAEANHANLRVVEPIWGGEYPKMVHWISFRGFDTHIMFVRQIDGYANQQWLSKRCRSSTRY